MIRGRRRGSGGFTLIEVLVAMGIFALLSLVVLTFMFSSVESMRRGRERLGSSAAARAALNRVARDIREADAVRSVSPPDGASWVEVNTDFDADGTITNTAPESAETLRFEFDSAARTLVVRTPETAPAASGVLAEGVQDVTFDYRGSDLAFDWDGDGSVTWRELDAAPDHDVSGVGNANGALDVELPYVTGVEVSLVFEGADRDTYSAFVELRNRNVV